MSAPSILQDFEECPRCYATGATTGLHKHHIYGGPNRTTSDRLGFWVWLRWDVHMDLHDHREPWAHLQHQLRVDCQREFERRGGTREEFMALIGRNYL